jgi:HAMP domain-containing protein
VKRYWIDDAKIVKERMVVDCPNCETKIKLQRPQPKPDAAIFDQASAAAGTVAEPLPQTLPKSDWYVDQGLAGGDSGIGGLTIGKKMLLVFLTFIVLTGAILAGLYMKYVPALMHEQVDLRTYSISRAFSTAIQQPLLIKNYLLVNQMAGTNAKLPGVAYVSVLNKKGVVVAGILGDSERFSSSFMQTVKEKGFPKEIASKNPIASGSKESALDFSIDGHKIHDVAVSIGETGGEAHVGLFTEDVEAAVHASLVPLVALLVTIAFLGSLSFIFVARTISTPIRALTEAAEKISLGDIDLPIEVKGQGEIGELASSLERMRFSIKAAMNRMRRN